MTKAPIANLRSKKAQKANEPSLRDKLSANFLKAFETDFDTHGVEVIEQLRQKSPEKYTEIAARLIAASEPKPDGFESCQDMREIGIKLLKSVGCEDEDAITEDMIAEALKAQEVFIAGLKAIRDAAQGTMQ